MTTDAGTGGLEADSDIAEGNRLGWRNWVLILTVAAAACFFRLGDARSLTEHEIQAAGGAKQMALDHDWLLPKIGDHLFLEKPPLLHWLMIVSAKMLGGFSEASMRLPSVLAGLGVIVVMALLAERWFGARTAIFTAILLTTTVHFITYARLAEPDMLLAFIVVLALFVFVRLHSIGGHWPEPHRYLPVLFWVLVGLSNMTKGLGFGPLLILAPCLTFLILKRDRVAWRRMISWSGWTLGLVIAVAWPVIVAVHVPEARELWREEITRRAVGDVGYQQPWWYYLTTAPWQLLPWTPVFLVAAGPSLVRAKRTPDSPDRFIWCWVLVPIVLLSFFRGKHHHYIISCLCAVSPLCAIGLLRFGIRFATAFVAVTFVAILFIHALVLPRFDRSHDDCEFLRKVRNFVPPETLLAATGGREVARDIFYVDPPPLGIWDPATLEQRFSGRPFYLISRRNEESRLTKLGQVEVVSQSKHTRAEREPTERLTLFRIEPRPL
ncbi:MAG TPA: glycosyltransferase family 39 protein [Chthoniobacterales bacterium]